MDREALTGCSPWGRKESDTTESHTHTHTHTHTRTNLGASHVVLMLKEPTSQCGRLKRRSLIPGSKDPLGEGMATHSSVLAWRIPWAEEPGRLQSIESYRVRHNQNDLAGYVQILSLFELPKMIRGINAIKLVRCLVNICNM